MKYSKNTPAGLGKTERAQLAAILRQNPFSFTIQEAALSLNINQTSATKLLARFTDKGWLVRLKAGVYMPVPLESETTDINPESPFALAEKLYMPCYIGGFSAAEYWGLTEQIYQSVVVMVQQQRRDYRPIIQGIQYLLYLVKEKKFFGLKSVWQNNVKIKVSDPTRTIVDLLNAPSWGGGIRASIDIIKNYFNSKDKSEALLIEYLNKFNNGAVYKRLGFILEKYYPEETQLITTCRNKLTAGNAKLDTSLDSDKLITRWRLWVPKEFK